MANKHGILWILDRDLDEWDADITREDCAGMFKHGMLLLSMGVKTWEINTLLDKTE